MRPHRLAEVTHQLGDTLAGVDRGLGRVTMSAFMPTANCAIDSAEVASPAVFHVMTRTLVSVFSGSASVPVPRWNTRAPFPRGDDEDQREGECERAHGADEGAQQRQGRGCREHRCQRDAERDHLGQGERALKAESGRPGQSQGRGGAHEREHDSEQPTHAPDPR